MNNPVQGEGVIIDFLKGGEFLPYGCARSTTLNLVSDTIAKSTVGSGNWKEKEVVALDWNFTIEGLIYLGGSGSFLASDIYEQWFSMQPIQIEFFVSDDGGNFIMMGGTALITAVSTNGAVNNVASFNITGEGTGALISTTSFKIINVAPNTPIAGQTTLTFDFDTVPGATAYTIKVNDITAATSSDHTGGGPPRSDIVVNSAHSYSFQLKAEPSGTFGPKIYWP